MRDDDERGLDAATVPPAAGTGVPVEGEVAAAPEAESPGPVIRETIDIPEWVSEVRRLYVEPKPEALEHDDSAARHRRLAGLRSLRRTPGARSPEVRSESGATEAASGEPEGLSPHRLAAIMGRSAPGETLPTPAPMNGKPPVGDLQPWRPETQGSNGAGEPEASAPVASGPAAVAPETAVPLPPVLAPAVPEREQPPVPVVAPVESVAPEDDAREQAAAFAVPAPAVAEPGSRAPEPIEVAAPVVEQPAAAAPWASVAGVPPALAPAAVPTLPLAAQSTVVEQPAAVEPLPPLEPEPTVVEQPAAVEAVVVLPQAAAEPMVVPPQAAAEPMVVEQPAPPSPIAVEPLATVEAEETVVGQRAAAEPMGPTEAHAAAPTQRMHLSWREADALERLGPVADDSHDAIVLEPPTHLAPSPRTRSQRRRESERTGEEAAIWAPLTEAAEQEAATGPGSDPATGARAAAAGAPSEESPATRSAARAAARAAAAQRTRKKRLVAVAVGVVVLALLLVWFFLLGPGSSSAAPAGPAGQDITAATSGTHPAADRVPPA